MSLAVHAQSGVSGAGAGWLTVLRFFLPCAGCWIRRKQKRRHDAEKAELLKRMEEETLRAKYAANGAALTVLQSHL